LTDGRTEVTILGLAVRQLPLEFLDLLCLIVGYNVVLGGGRRLTTHSQTGSQTSQLGTCRLFQLGIVFLRLDEVEHHRERARQDEGEEQAEPCQIHVPLGASRWHI
jgi:hypothetical protein